MVTLKQAVIRACEAALSHEGFRRTRGALVRTGMDGHGWVGLNILAPKPTEVVKINPVMGVCFDRLDSLAHQLRDDIPEGFLPAASRPLGYLMPAHSIRFWEFRSDGVDTAAADLASAVHEYGLRFVEEYSNWATFSRAVESSGLLLEHEKAKTYPMVLALNGELTRASEFVVCELERVRLVGDMYAESYRRFAHEFHRKFSSDDLSRK